MSTKEDLIERLRKLCDRVGGIEEVAGKTHLNPVHLGHILKGVKVAKTGVAKGVGPKIQRRLDLHYPGWSQLDPGEPKAATDLNEFSMDDPLQILRDLEDIPQT